MLSMLFLGILSLATDAKSSVEPLNRTLALYTNNKFSVENSAQLMLCMIDDNPETQAMKRQYMAQFRISDEREYNGIAIHWIIKEICTMDNPR
jgi:hypothetical protein